MLESYIAPLFTGYVDKYIKNLKPSDLSLSLWGGDVVLQNLELNLDVLQQELNLPVTFLSGKIHKFQLHVPWTRLIYEPVVITIDTMEFIVKLNDGDVKTEQDEQETTEPSDVDPLNQPSANDSNTQEQMPPGYVQGILNKVINNISFKINNIIIKYVEDDIVFSLNVKSVDFYCADAKWERSFIDLALPELVLRRVCNITDLTICLDHRNTSGKIELYQDPVLYKCNLSCRILSHYRGLSSTKPIENKVDIFCERFDFSLTDLQIPMVMRLIKLVIGLFYGTLDLPGCEFKKHTAPTIIEKHKKATSNNVSSVVPKGNLDDSWSSWAWSMVPGVSATAENEETSFKKDIKFCLGLFVSSITFTLKSTNQSSDILANHRLEFSPRLCLELRSCVVEFLSIGDLFIDVNVGVGFILGYMVGNYCICNIAQQQLDETLEELNEDEIFLKIGETQEENNLQFLCHSLFTDLLPVSLNTSLDVTEEEKQVNASELKEGFPTEHTAEEKLHDVFVKDTISGSKFSDEEILTKYGTVFLNYNYEMSLPDLTAGDIENIFLYPETDEVVPEVSEKRLFLSSCQLYVSTTLFHTVTWLADVCSAKLPLRKEKPGVYLDPFVLQQLQLGNLLSRQTSLTVLNSVAYVFHCNHKRGGVQGNSFQEEKEAVTGQVDSFKLVKVDPMYPLELSTMLKEGKMIKLRQNMKNLNTLVSVEVVGLQSGLSLINQETLKVFTLNILQPVDFNASVNSTLLPENIDLAFPVINNDYHFECNDMSLLFTKLHLLLCYNVLHSWITEKQNSDLIQCLAQSVFHPGGGDGSVPLMNVQLCKSSFQMVDMTDLCAIQATIQALNATLQSVGSKGSIENVQLFTMPCKTSDLSDINAWNESQRGETPEQPVINLTLQWQKSKSAVIQFLSLEMAGSCLNFDVVLYNWISQKPSVKNRKATMTTKPEINRQSSRLGSHSMITTPKRTKSYARMFGSATSTSHNSKEKDNHTATNNSVFQEIEEKPKVPFGEWVAQKINVFKSFHINVNIGAFVLVCPEKQWPKGFATNGNIITAVNSVYQDKTSDCLSSIVICCPKLSARSSHNKQHLHQQQIPILQDKTPARKVDTLPWTITSSDFAVLSLFPNDNTLISSDHVNKKIETVYICKPVSCKLYLAAAPSNNSVSRNVTKLGNISEQNVSFENPLPPTSASSSGHHVTLQKSHDSKLKHTIGFVVHADWSVCECFISERQMKLAVNIGKNVYRNIESFMEAQKQAPAYDSKQPQTTQANKEQMVIADLLSKSSQSTIDLPDNFSSLTGSSNVPNKVSPRREVDVSLWIQCTLPKVKLSILSHAKQPYVYYQVTSEIDEIMFAFDYQDNTLELTNKISSFMIHYSMLRFDIDPVGWVIMKNGFMFCQKEKRESSHIDSNTFLSVHYRRTKQITQSNIGTNLLAEKATSGGEFDTTNTVGSSVISVEEELVVKHEVNISIQCFDVICIANPVLSSVSVFTSALRNCIGFKSPVSHQQIPSPNYNTKQRKQREQTTEVSRNIITWPVTTIHCDSVRLIMPYGDQLTNDEPSIITDDEQLLLLHLHAVHLISNPVNPITKTVVDKTTYQQLKQCYREPMKKLKLWNVQYQLDITNIGLCTTSWKSVVSSLPENKTILGKQNSSQNPAVEWNSLLSPEQHKVTPIFMGFDFKATIAPPVMLHLNNSVHAVTSAAIEYHSPRPIKLYINSSQIALSLQLLDDANTLLTELSSLLDTQSSPLPEIGTPLLQQHHRHHQQHTVNTDSGIHTQVLSDGGKTKRNATPSPSSFFPSVELFGSISSISVIFYHRTELEIDRTASSTATIVKSATSTATSLIPVLALTLVQPTCSLNTLSTPSFQFTLLDLSVSTSSMHGGFVTDNVIPQLQAYDITVLSCAKGETNQMSGLLPTFIKFSLTIPQPGNMRIDAVIEKSVFLKCNYSLFSNLNVFKEALLNIYSKTRTKNEEVEKANAAKEQDVETQPSLNTIKLSALNIKTNQFHALFSMSQPTGGQITSFTIQYYSLDIKSTLHYCERIQTLNDCKLKTSIDGMNIGTLRDGERSVLLAPANITAEIKFISAFHTDDPKNPYPRRLYIWADCGVIEFCVCQQLYDSMNTVLSEITATIFGGKSQKDKNETADGVAVEELVKERISLDLNESVDDLRNGKFSYNLLRDTSNEMVAEPNQIVFSNEEDHVTPVMTWRYTEPRIITEIYVMPVPFYIPDKLKQPGMVGCDLEKIRCYLQYWKELDREYINCCAFDLSENDSSRLIIADKNNLMGDTVNLSQYWRVVILTTQNVERLNLRVDATDMICPVSPVLSTSLAACLKINSCASPSLVPSVELRLDASLVQFVFSNDTVPNVGETCNKRFKGFVFHNHEEVPDYLEALKISFRNANTSLSLCSQLRADVRLDTRLDINVMDFNNLCWVDFVTPTDLKCHVVKALSAPRSIPDCIDVETNIDVELDESDVLITQTAVHTLFLTAKSWTTLIDKENRKKVEDLNIFNHYVLCNQTLDCLHVQQVGTNEDITLQSGELFPYSWCTRDDHQLRFCLESANDWKWSKPFSIDDEEGIKTRQLEHKGYSSIFFIEVKRIGGVQKQIIFHGCCTFVNNLSIDVDMEVVTQETEHSITYFHHNVIDVSRKISLTRGKPTRSLTISHHFIKNLRIFGSDSNSCSLQQQQQKQQQQKQQPQQQQTAEVQFPNSENDADVFSMLMVNNKLIYVWISVRPNKLLVGQKVVSISPMYMVRNLLSEPVILNVGGRDSNEQYEIVSEGKGKETQIFNLRPQQWLNFSFTLPGASECSKPLLAMNTTMSKLLQENNSICNEEFCQERWPYVDHTEQTTSKSSSSHKISYQAERKPKSPGPENMNANKSSLEAELYFQASLRWPELPTILIDLKPSLLICNLSQMRLLVKGIDTGCLYRLEPNQSLSPFYIKELLTIGVLVQGKELWSPPLRLGMRTSNFQDTTILEECIKVGSTTQLSIFDKEHITCFQFSFKFIRSDGVYVVTIKERFLLHNLSNYNFLVTTLMFHDTCQTLERADCLELNKSTELPFAMLNVVEKKGNNKSELTGLAVHFELNLRENTSACEGEKEKQDRISQSRLQHRVIKRRDLFILSEEHLREWICLSNENNDVHNGDRNTNKKIVNAGQPFVLTSMLDDDVINIFIKEDTCSIINITNNLHKSLVLKELTKEKQANKHYAILEADHNKMTCLPSAQTSQLQPVAFKTLFPKTNNVLEMSCQFGVYSSNTVELSKPVTLGKEGCTSVYVPELGEVFFKVIVRNSQLFLEINDTKTTEQTLSTCSKPLPLPPFRLEISSLNFMLIDTLTHHKIESLLSLSLSALTLLHVVGDERNKSSNFKLALGGLQLDNQSQDACYHFPVIFLPMRELSQRYHTVTSDAPFPDLGACLDADFCSVTLAVCCYDSNTENRSIVCIDSIQVKLQPCEMYLEDTFVYRLSEALGSYVPMWTRKKDLLIHQKEKRKLLLEAVNPILLPMRICSIDIDETSVLLSIHASVKMFVAADHIPLRMGRFKCHPTQTVSEEFARMLLYHYATQVLVRVGWILGSLDIIGNPTGLIHSIGRGLSDFFIMPYQGLTRGPTAFVSGISHGITSFLRHVTTGTLTSITNVSLSISRNMDRLCFDENYILLQEQRRAQAPTRAVTGLQNAFGSLAISLLGAVAGLVDHSIQNVAAANTTTEAVTGLVTGFAKGMVGVIAKPIGGAMEFVSQTSLGVLQGTGLVRVPERISLLDFDLTEDLGREESCTKFIWQYLHLKNGFDVFVTSCNMPNIRKQQPEKLPAENVPSEEMTNEEISMKTGTLILTQTALFLYDNQSSDIVSAFPFKEINMLMCDVDNDVISIKLFKRLENIQPTNRMSLDENPNFRHFFESFQEASVSCEAERLYENISTNESLVLEVEIPKIYALMFQTRYDANKMRTEDTVRDTEKSREALM